jgi:hypothetical protein
MAVHPERSRLPDVDPTNPVARAHARREPRADAVRESRLGTLLVWTVVIPALLALVSNPVGWILLFFLVLAVGALVGFGGIL